MALSVRNGWPSTARLLDTVPGRSDNPLDPTGLRFVSSAEWSGEEVSVSVYPPDVLFKILGIPVRHHLNLACVTL